MTSYIVRGKTDWRYPVVNLQKVKFITEDTCSTS